MSFRKFGGTNKLEKNNNITAHSIVADNFTIRNAFLSVFTIDGDLKINGNGFISKSIIANVSLQTATLDVSLNATIDGNLYLDKQKTVFFNGNNYMIGLNKLVPTATLDIVSSQIGALNIKSLKNENRNIIARNMWNHGVAVDVAGNTLAAIQFYSGTNNIDLSNNSNAKISYENVGNVLVINSDGGTKITSNLIIAANVSVSNAHTAYGETVLIYDHDNTNSTFFIESYENSLVKTGSAVTIQAINDYSNTYMNIVAPNRLGLNIGGGVYPNDITRSMGIIDVYNPVTGSLNDDVATPAQIIISGNTFTKFNATTGFNTFNPDYNKYAVDINGPVHLNNGEIKMTQTTINRINQIIPLDTTQHIYAIGGYDGVTSSQSQRRYIYESINGGKTWSILNQTIDPTGILTNAVILKMYASSNTTVVFGDEGSFISITVDSGSTWRSAILTGVSTNIKTIYISGLNIFVGGSDGKILSGTIELVGAPPQYQFTGTTYPYTEIQALSRTISDSAFCANNNKLFFVGGKYIYSYTVSTNTLTYTNTIIESSVSTASYNKIKFNGANGIAVGTDIISYTTNSGTTWADYSIAGVTLNDVHILGSNTHAIAVGNGGKIYYTSNTGYSVWTLMTIETINSSGIGSTIINNTNDITSINMTDSSTIILSIVKNNDGGAYKSKLFYLNMPNIFNRGENHILDISGCIHTSGDIHISENGKLISNNTEFYMVNETVGNLYLAGDAKLVKIGSTTTGNVIIGGSNTLTKLGPLIIGNLYQGNVQINNNLITGNLYTTSISNVGNIIANNIIVGNLTLIGIELIDNTMASTSTNTGALVVSGGVGIGGDIYTSGKFISINDSTPIISGAPLKYSSGFGSITSLDGMALFGNLHVVKSSRFQEDIFVNGNLTVLGSLNSTSAITSVVPSPWYGESTNDANFEAPNYGTAALSALGGVIIAKRSLLIGNVRMTGIFNEVFSTTESTATNSGALVISGGLGVCKNTNIGGNVLIYSTLESSNTDTGALRITGGIGIRGNANIGGNIIIYSNTESNDTNSGSIRTIGGIGIGRNTNIGGIVTIYSTTESTTTATGALKVFGGVGIVGNVNIGRNTNIGGATVINSTNESNATNSGALQILGGVGIGKNAHIGGDTIIYSTTESSTTATGAIRTLGGIGIARNANIGGDTIIYSTTESSTTATGAIRTLGGIGIARNANIGGDTMIYSTTESSTTATGAIRTLGGIGIAKNAHIGGSLAIYSTTDSNDTQTGAIQVLGGVGIKSNLNVGGTSQLMNAFMNNSTVSNTSTTTKSIILGTDTTDTIANGALTINGGIGLLGSIHSGGNVIVYSTIDSTSTGAGAITVAGGVGIRGNTNIGGITIVYSTIDSASTTTGALRILGGGSVGKNLYVGSSLFITSGLTVGTAATVTGNLRVTGTSLVQQESVLGSATIAGGLTVLGTTTLQATTVAGSFNIGSGGVTSTMNGTILITGTTASTTTSSGALQIRGGLGVNGTVTALAFNAVSDVRTKTNINDLSNSGLETLRKLKPKEFSYIDGTRDSVYGFIAQEIREVIPKSVIIQPNYIPSIYEYAIVHAHADNNKITLINKTTSDMAGRKLRIHDRQKNEVIVNVTEVVDEKTFIIDENISSHLTSIDIDGNRLDVNTVDGIVKYFKGSQEYDGEVQMGIFIYGIYVEDFHVLNKDTIWTVALIATQEMDTQLQDARQNIKTLEERIMEIERRLS